MPVSFGDIASSALDVLNNDFKLNKKFVKSKIKAGAFTFTTENTLKSKDGSNSIAGKVSTSWSGINGFKMPKLSMDASGKTEVEWALENAVDGLVFTFSATHPGDDASLELVYDQENTHLETTLDLNFSSVEQSATFAYKQFVAGAFGAFDIEKTALSDYNVGLSYNAGKTSATAFTSTAKGDAKVYNLACSHPVGEVTVAAHAKLDAGFGFDALQVGGEYACNKATTMRASVDTKMHLKAAVAHKVMKNVKAVGCVDVDLANVGKSTPAYGVNLTLG